MCLGVCFFDKSKINIVEFTDKPVTLPIDTSNKQTQFILWGRTIKSYGKLPLGGWLLQPLFQQGKWNEFFPKLVKIPAVKFMEEDLEGKSHWFDVISGSYIQGVILRHEKESRVYIMTLIPELPNNAFPRWPVMVY